MSIYTENNLTLSDLTAADGGFLLFLLDRLVNANLENDIPVLQCLDTYIESVLSKGCDEFLKHYQAYRTFFGRKITKSVISRFVGIMSIQLVNIFQKEINKMSINYNIWHILTGAKYINVNKRFLLMLIFSVSKNKNLPCDTEYAWNKIAGSLQRELTAKIQRKDTCLVRNFISTTNMCIVNCKNQEIAMISLFSYFNIFTPTWEKNPKFYWKIIKQMLHNYDIKYYQMLHLLNTCNMETFISVDENEHFNIFPILLVFYLTYGEDNAGQTLPSANSQTDRETLIRLFSKLYSLPEEVIVSKNDQSSVGGLISTIVDLKKKIQTRCWTEKTNIQKSYQIKDITTTRFSYRQLHASYWNFMAYFLYRYTLILIQIWNFKNLFGEMYVIKVSTEDMFFIFLSCLFTYLMLGLAGAELKKYLSLKYSYKEAALLLLWISNDVHRNPGPKSDLEQPFSVKLRKVTLNMCKKLLTLYQGRELSKSPNNLYKVETDFDLCNVLDGKEISVPCMYKDLDTEVLIDILLQCFKEKRISWKKSGYEMELLQKEIDAWESCEFDQLFNTHFTSTILEKTADIASKLERMAKYLKRDHLNEVLKEIGISFQPLTPGSSENDASLCWLASRSIASIFYNVVKDSETSKWPSTYEELLDPNNGKKKLDPNDGKKKQKQKIYFKQLFEFCEKEYPENRVLKENKSYVEACKNWIDDSKQKVGLIEQYISRHDKEVVKKMLQSLGEDDLILEAIPILAERGITLSTTNYCTQKNSLEKGPVKRKSEASHSATLTQRTDVSCKKTPKEKELNRKTEIKIKLWVNGQLKDVTVKTHGKTIDFKELCQKGCKEVKIKSEDQGAGEATSFSHQANLPQIDYPATTKTQVCPQHKSCKSVEKPTSLEDTTSSDLQYQELWQLNHITHTTSTDSSSINTHNESKEESLNQTDAINQDSMTLLFENATTRIELLPTTDMLPELTLLQDFEEIPQQSSANTTKTTNQTVTNTILHVDTPNDNVSPSTSRNMTDLWNEDKEASDEDHRKKTDEQSASENIYKNEKDGKISQETREITSFSSDDNIQMFDKISWDNEDLATLLENIGSVNEHSGNDSFNSYIDQPVDSPNLLSMDFLDDIDNQY